MDQDTEGDTSLGRSAQTLRVWHGDHPVDLYPSATAPIAHITLSEQGQDAVRLQGCKVKGIRPRHRQQGWTEHEDGAELVINRPSNLVVELENGQELYLFADLPEKALPDPEDPDVIYFSPGVHYPGTIHVSSGQTVYLAEGAVVHGNIKDDSGVPWAAQGQNKDAFMHQPRRPFAENVRICGRGVLSGKNIPRGEGSANAPYGIMIDLYNVKGVCIEGITIDAPPYWVVVPRLCEDIRVRNLKVIGPKINNDGIQFRNCRRVHVKGGFFRTNDDAIAIKGFNDCNRASNRDMLFEGLVIDNRDGGQALEIGHSAKCAYISRVTFRDIDILNSNFEALSIHSVDAAHICDIRYEDIRIEKADHFIECIVTKSKYSHDPSGNIIRGIVFKDISSTTNSVSIDAEDVVFDNVSVNGVQVTGPAQLSGRIRPSVTFGSRGSTLPPGPDKKPGHDASANLLEGHMAWRFQWREFDPQHPSSAPGRPFPFPCPLPEWAEIDLEFSTCISNVECCFANALLPAGCRLAVRPDLGEWKVFSDQEITCTSSSGSINLTFPPMHVRFLRVLFPHEGEPPHPDALLTEIRAFHRGR